MYVFEGVPSYMNPNSNNKCTPRADFEKEINAL